MEEHLEWLGWAVKDKVTGFKGVVTHVGCDLQGCVQAVVHPVAVSEKSGAQKLENSCWFDVSRLIRQGSQRVMEPIPIKVQGPEMNKPIK